MNYLTLPLKGFAQHYSSKSQLVTAPSGIYYKTDKYPTKSAVIGMIGAALGVAREDKEKLEELYNSLDIKYRTIRKGNVGVDFQTVRPLHKGERFKKVAGGNKPETDTIVKHIEYLFDYSFEVYIGGEETLLQDIRAAFECPVYPPYIGKRSCMAPKLEFLDGFTDLEDKKDVYNCP